MRYLRYALPFALSLLAACEAPGYGAGATGLTGVGVSPPTAGGNASRPWTNRASRYRGNRGDSR